jgi:hypothetical protein
MADLKGAMDGLKTHRGFANSSAYVRLPSNEGQVEMKFCVTSICALALSSAAIAQNISAEDFDLACAVTAGAIFGSNPKAGAERDAATASVGGTTRRSGIR